MLLVATMFEAIFSMKVLVKVTRSSTLVSIERVLSVEYSLLLVMAKFVLAMDRQTKRQDNTISYATRIEPVGKPYREVCLRSELWPWMAHHPNSWSKHPGTRIEQVLAYCRAEQKYVGCIELLFCLTVTMTFGVRT